MRMKAGEVLAGRFVLTEDEPPLAVAAWVRGIDNETGEAVLCRPPFTADRTRTSMLEGLARDVQALALEWVVPIIKVGPGVVVAEPPPESPRPVFTPAAAAALALQACEVVAHMHTLGAGAAFADLRLTERDGAWRVAWLIPTVSGLPEIYRLDPPTVVIRPNKPLPLPDITTSEVGHLFSDDETERDTVVLTETPFVARAQRHLVEFYASLLAPDAALPPTLQAIRTGTSWCSSVAALAREFLSIVADPDAWTAWVDALPVVHTVPERPRDWDAIVADQEAALAAISPPSNPDPEVAAHGEHLTEYARGRVAVVLAGAYHQRALRSLEQGDASAALADVERALRVDRCIGYEATRAVLLDRLGHTAEARAAIAEAVARSTSLDLLSRSHESFHDHAQSMTHRDLARVLATAGLFALHDGDLAEATRSLQRSLELHATAEAAHALGAALYRLGEVTRAAEVEARSVELDPSDLRNRWALVVSLVRLGRIDEAKQHADAALRQAPDDPEQRRRYARVFA